MPYVNWATRQRQNHPGPNHAAGDRRSRYQPLPGAVCDHPSQPAQPGSDPANRFTALNGQVGGLERNLGTLTTLTLVAESDAPCRFQLSRADLSYRLTYQGFSPTAAAPAKQVLRFQGSDLGPQSLPLTLPPQVRAASLSLSLSLGTQQQPADSLAPVPPSLPSQIANVTLPTVGEVGRDRPNLIQQHNGILR